VSLQAGWQFLPLHEIIQDSQLILYDGKQAA